MRILCRSATMIEAIGSALWVCRFLGVLAQDQATHQWNRKGKPSFLFSGKSAIFWSSRPRSSKWGKSSSPSPWLMNWTRALETWRSIYTCLPRGLIIKILRYRCPKHQGHGFPLIWRLHRWSRWDWSWRRSRWSLRIRNFREICLPSRWSLL